MTVQKNSKEHVEIAIIALATLAIIGIIAIFSLFPESAREIMQGDVVQAYKTASVLR